MAFFEVYHMNRNPASFKAVLDDMPIAHVVSPTQGGLFRVVARPQSVRCIVDTLMRVERVRLGDESVAIEYFKPRHVVVDHKAALAFQDAIRGIRYRDSVRIRHTIRVQLPGPFSAVHWCDRFAPRSTPQMQP